MRLTLDARATRLLRGLPRANVYSLLELALLFLLAVQCARLIWAVATPVGPLGEWRGDAGLTTLAAASPAQFEAFDPFFRLEGGAPVVVTDLDIRLFGVRQDRATGRGSAIIQPGEGEQSSYLVGEEIMPGVRLESVGFDFVTILRDNRREQIFLDQSGPAGSAAAPAGIVAPASPRRPGAPVVAQPSEVVVTPGALSRDTRIAPRREGDRMTGVILQPNGEGEAFRAAGFQPGDVLISINGRRVTNAGEAARFATEIGSGALVQVERGGETVAFRARVSE